MYSWVYSWCTAGGSVSACTLRWVDPNPQWTQRTPPTAPATPARATPPPPSPARAPPTPAPSPHTVSEGSLMPAIVDNLRKSPKISKSSQFILHFHKLAYLWSYFSAQPPVSRYVPVLCNTRYSRKPSQLMLLPSAVSSELKRT